MLESAQSAPAEESALGRLLATEERLDALLADAARKAETAIGEAEAQARVRLGALDEEVATAVVSLGRRLDEERRQRLARLEAETRRTLEAIGALGELELEGLARRVVERVLASNGTGVGDQ